uniref:Potassium calcium-activated channel subfamily M regulatory beta subunit 4 n=1 Tax=Apteryx owenii TaxID=8824 RepID=A0A8B9P411_APTOW
MARSRPAYEYTEAEDRSMRLGFLLIAAGLLSLLVLGFCWLRPALQERRGGGAANCTVLAVRQLGERFACTFSCGAACRGTARYPCLQVLVRTSRSAAPALLHEDERQLRTNPKCSYIPPCARDDQENSENVTYKQKYWKEKVGSQPFTCYFNQHLRTSAAQPWESASTVEASLHVLSSHSSTAIITSVLRSNCAGPQKFNGSLPAG